ncbi:MAG TPA: SDR family NAD(P)-dependent oxidoreductase [Acidimicrobiales bacterium]|jgi:NAD(P)-dependent dehydrogenase (short-subunit alcohol dehydrogenase family)|nr:SDR family NAD(P)-dependent oxidoreductase [Acidimicrobiales bacterium]MDP7208241.1 SDR family NAD(P)-dependent oxidoreductase [Acidimicrobiales bacterium]HJL90618.1 SDR family NAD(P)-dependent oxidoreductase [Acidimicrobiales bacterium]HJO98587.1 SDR family NAD(P)-dependent oxidoreductase [Acidimicrobiales bacterium]|tara:strand:- start:7201 stop:7968 length:768 start_codon:yes stop_codon:yes gene_type:complete
MNLNGRSTLVTGGAGGLGEAVVRLFAAAGASVVIFDAAADRARQLADELGDSVLAVAGDVLSEISVGEAVEVATGLGELSAVAIVHGAGVAGRTVNRDGTPHDLDLFQRTINLNIVGTFNVVRLAAVAMAGNEPDEHGQCGVFINTASIAGLEGQTGQVAYGSAKAGIIGMTLPVARDLSPMGIRINTIAPGTMGTPLMRSMPEEMQEKLVSTIPFPRRMGEPAEFAALVGHIVENPYLNGEVIRLDGALRFPPK